MNQNLNQILEQLAKIFVLGSEPERGTVDDYCVGVGDLDATEMTN